MKPSIIRGIMDPIILPMASGVMARMNPSIIRGIMRSIISWVSSSVMDARNLSIICSTMASFSSEDMFWMKLSIMDSIMPIDSPPVMGFQRDTSTLGYSKNPSASLDLGPLSLRKVAYVQKSVPEGLEERQGVRVVPLNEDSDDP